MNLNDIIFNNRENKRKEEAFNPQAIHCDFEIGLIGAIKHLTKSWIKNMPLAFI